MRILCLAADALGLGGVESFQLDLAADLAAAGGVDDYRVMNLDPARGARERPPFVFDAPRARPWFRGPLIGLWWRRVVRRLRPDVVMTHQPAAREFVARFVDARPPFHLAVVHNDSDRDGYWDGLRRRRDSVDLHVAVSRRIAERLVGECGIAADRVAVVPCGVVVPPEAPPAAGRDGFLLAGRLIREPKRVHDLAAVARALAARPGAAGLTLRVAGDGPEAGPLRAALEDAAPPLRVEWLGRVSRDGLRALFGRSLAILQFSSREGMPLAVREAMAHGAVPVLSDAPAHRELVADGENGLLFPVGDAARCADRCMSLLEPGRAEALAVAARATVREHDRVTIARRYRDLARTMTATARATPGAR